MLFIDSTLVLLALSLPFVTGEPGPHDPGVIAQPRAEQAQPHLPSVEELSRLHGDPLIPDGRDAADVQAEIDEVNELWSDAVRRQHALIEEVADEKIARGDDDVFVGGERPQLADGAIGRRILVTGLESVGVDVFDGDSVALDLVREELAVIHAMGEGLLDGYFDRSLPTAPSVARGIGQASLGCKCEFTSNYTPGGTPPDCIQSWGVSYSVMPGICDEPQCGAPKPCKGTMMVSMTETAGNMCDSLGLHVDSEPGQLSWTSTGFFSWTVEVNIDCGDSVTLHWSANGINLGSTELTCEECPVCADD